MPQAHWQSHAEWDVLEHWGRPAGTSSEASCHTVAILTWLGKGTCIICLREAKLLQLFFQESGNGPNQWKSMSYCNPNTWIFRNDLWNTLWKCKGPATRDANLNVHLQIHTVQFLWHARDLHTPSLVSFSTKNLLTQSKRNCPDLLNEVQSSLLGLFWKESLQKQSARDTAASIGKSKAGHPNHSVSFLEYTDSQSPRNKLDDETMMRIRQWKEWRICLYRQAVGLLVDKTSTER